MSEQQENYTTTHSGGHASYTSTANLPVSIAYVDDAPDVREYLINLRRDLLRKVKQLDELIARIEPTKPHA